MKNIIYLLIFLIGASLLGQQKEVDIKAGQLVEKKMANGFQSVIGETEEGFYVFRAKEIKLGVYGTKPRDLFIDKYDHNLNYVKTLEIEGVRLGKFNSIKGENFEFFIQGTDGNIFMFYSENKNGYNYLYKKKLLESSFTFGNAEMHTKQKVVNGRYANRPVYSLVKSEDKSHIAIYSTIKSNKIEGVELYLEVFDGNLNSKWIQKGPIPNYTDKSNTKTIELMSTIHPSNDYVKSVSLSNTGVLNIATFDEDNHYINHAWRQETGLYLLYSFSANKLEPTIREIFQGDRYLEDIILKHNQENNLNLTGFFRNDKNEVYGLVYYTINPINLEDINSRVIDFSEEEKETFFVSEKNHSKTGKESIEDKELRRKIEKDKNPASTSKNIIYDVYVCTDNSMTIVSQYYDSYLTSVGDNYATIHQYGDLKFVNFSSEGKINWIKNYDKYHSSASQEYLSVYGVFSQNRLYFVYNDLRNGRRNLGIFDMKSGKVTTEQITASDENGSLVDFLLHPARTYESSNNAYIFSNELKRDKLRLLKMTLK